MGVGGNLEMNGCGMMLGRTPKEYGLGGLRIWLIQDVQGKERERRRDRERGEIEREER